MTTNPQPTLFPTTPLSIPKVKPPLRITNSLKEKSILVDFDGGFYNWSRRDRRVENAVATANNVRASAGHYLKNLFLGCDTPLQAIRQRIQTARLDSDNMTLPWGTGRRLLLNVNVLAYQQTQSRHSLALDEAKANLSSAYSTLISNAAATLGPLYDPSEYPTLDTMLDSCYISHRFYPLADASDVRLSCDSTLVAEIQAQVQQEADDTYSRAVLSTWERLLSIIESATTNLAKGLEKSSTDRFRTEWHDHLSTFLPLLSGLNLASDPRLDAMAQRCQSLLRPDPDEYKVSLTTRAKAYTQAQAIFDDLSSIYGTMSPTKEPK